MIKGLYIRLTGIVFSTCALVGCGSDGLAGGTFLLSEIVYQDQGVKGCVTKHILDNEWVTIEDVRYLNCPKTGKSHIDSGEEGIWNTKDLKQFIFLEDLDISGHYYTSFDISPLARLKHLNMNMSFIKSIAFSENVLLETIDVGSTLVTNLDFSQNYALRDVRATAESYHTEAYQLRAINKIDSLLEDAGLPYEKGAELREVTLEAIVERAVVITLSSSVALGSLEVSSNAVIEYID